MAKKCKYIMSNLLILYIWNGYYLTLYNNLSVILFSSADYDDNWGIDGSRD